MALSIRKGDKVKILAGKNRGKTGKILRVEKKKNAVIVEGVNLRKKHTKPTQKNPKGGVIQTEGPIHLSNVQLVCPACGKITRPLMKESEKERVRLCRKCQAQL